MPPLPSANKVIKVEISGTFGDTSWANIFHLLYTGGPATDASLVNLDTAQGATMIRPWNHQCSSVLEVTQVKYTDLSSPTAAQAVIAKSVFGTVGGTGLAANTACCVNFPTARRYRGGHCRMYIGGLSSADQATQNSWQSSFLANMHNDFAAALAGLNAYSSPELATLTWVQLSYRTGGAPRVTPVTDPVIGIAVQDRICTIRRRLGPSQSDT
jgi:hypothetical protein